MKKYIFVLLLVLALSAVSVGLASANNGPHGGYTPTTDACAGCHRAHTAQGPRLLITNTTFALCMTCHGSAAAGAVTNVNDGIYEVGAGTPLNGGGFTNYQGAATTSTHDVSQTVAGAWGNAVNRGVTAPLAGGEFLNCASCHDPHGSPNYRIIKATINGNATSVSQVDEGAWDYDSESWPTNMSNVCSACHSSYHITSGGSGSDPAMVATGGYTHRVNMSYVYGSNVNPETTGYGGYFLPLAATGAGDLVTCNTCHMSHGASSTMAGFANGGPGGGGTPPGNTTATDSALLRLNNRGVCEVCHQK